MALSTPDFLQTKTYTAKAVRALIAELGLQPGVYEAGDMKVVQRAAGANMSVDVGVGAAWVRGTTVSRQGMYHVYNDGVVNLAVNAAHATLPRIDQVILRIFDSTDAGSGSDVPTLSVSAGTATSGATLDNRTGAAALPTNAIRLADILVPAASTSVVTANIRDRRGWARGAYKRIQLASGGDYTTTSTAVAGVALDDTNLRPRLECSGVPVRMSLRGRISHTAASSVRFNPLVDGVIPWTAGNTAIGETIFTAGSEGFLDTEWDILPTAASHLFSWNWYVANAGTGTLYRRADIPMEFVVEEILRADASND